MKALRVVRPVSRDVDECHMRGFTDFVAMEGLAGGPSPNVKLIGRMARVGRVEKRELWWRACCYAAVYNTAASAAVWTHWPFPRMIKPGSTEKLEAWLMKNWAGVPIHSNRMRTNGSPKRLAASLASLAGWVARGELETDDDFDALWQQVTGVRSVGRYFGIKLAGTLAELRLTKARQYDVRARGAKNGRATLRLMFPDSGVPKRGNSPAALREVDELAAALRRSLEEGYGLTPTWFEFEALLCEYNQCVKGDRYPGKTSDSDLASLERVRTHFGVDCSAVESADSAREASLPLTALGRTKRADLTGVYAEHGYMWSDAIYDYEATDDLRRPVLRGDAPAWSPLTTPPGGVKR